MKPFHSFAFLASNIVDSEPTENENDNKLDKLKVNAMHLHEPTVFYRKFIFRYASSLYARMKYIVIIRYILWISDAIEILHVTKTKAQNLK